MMIIIKFLMIFVLFNLPMVPGTVSTHDVVKEEKFKWTPELDAIVTKIYHETISKGKNHQTNIKKLWDRILPQFKSVNGNRLRRRAIDLLFTGGGIGKEHQIIWTPELESDLLGMYYDTLKSGGKTPSFELHNTFYNKYVNLPRLLPASLWLRAKIAHKKYHPNETVKVRKNIPWRDEFADELLRVYRQQPPNLKDQAQRLHKEWVKLHPEHKHVDPVFLQDRMREISKLKAKQGEKNQEYMKHKWTRQEHADLLHIYNQVEPEFSYTLKLQERWSKMHPQLDFMKKDSLRRLAQQLIKMHYKPTESEEGEAKRKFDNLPPLNDVSYRKKRRRQENEENSDTNRQKVFRIKFNDLPVPESDKEQRKKPHELNESTSATNLASMNPRLHQFYDFMSVNKSQRGSLNILNKSVQSSHVLNSSQASANNPNVFPNLRNYHYGETSNPSSHRQSDPAPSSSFQNPPRQFFRFL